MKCAKCGISYGKDEVYESFVYDRRGIKWGYKQPNRTTYCKECGKPKKNTYCKKCGTDLTAFIQPIVGGSYASTSEDFVPYWSYEDITNDLEYAKSKQDTIILVAETGDELIGFTWGYKLPLEKFPFLKGNIKGKASYIDEIAVNGDKRQRNIGTLLGRNYLETAEKQGMLEVVLRTDERNVASMALFKKLGFSDIPDLENPRLKVYDPEFPDRIYLKKELGE